MKKFSIVLTLIFSMFIGIMTTKADNITFDQVVAKINFLYGDVFKVTSTENSVSITDLRIEPERATVFTYDNGIISYAYEGTADGELAFFNVSIDNGAIIDPIIAVGTLHGYTETQIKNWYSQVEENFTNYTLEQNGIELTTDTFTFESDPVEMFNTFKIDINNVKIETLGNTDLIPKIKITKTTDKSATVNIAAVSDDSIMCEIYRSTNNVDYRLIGAINCGLGGYAEYDSGPLQPNTTYYFKATIEGYNNFSEVVNTTTLSSNVIKDKQDNQDSSTQQIANPNTADLNIVLVILVITGSIIIGYCAYQKKKFE